MLDVTLLTRGSPYQLSGGHLYHRRMAAAAGLRQARLDIRVVHPTRDPFREVGDVALIDSLAAAAVGPWLLATRRRPAALAAIVHQQPGGVGRTGLRAAVRRRLDALVYRRCDLVLVASPHVADQLRDQAGVPDDRIHVATPGRDLPPSAAPAEPRDLRAGRRIAVLCVGNWHPNKGILDVVEAVAALPHDAVTLHLVGHIDVDPPYRRRLRARLADPALADRVVVHGPVEPADLTALYAGADVFALASVAEAYGTVYAEALTAGLPIVGWRSGNLPNLIDDQVHGCLVDAGDVAGLSRALQRLADDGAVRAHLAGAARDRGGALPTWEDTADAFFGALSRLVEGRD